MRFKTSVKNISTFVRLTGSLSALGKVAWVNLNEETVRFTVIPDSGTQVWAVLSVETIFNDYRIASASNNVINLELPLDTLHRSLKSASLASAASLRLTKKADLPILSLTITTLSSASATPTIITQEIPVRVLTAQSVAGIHEPQCPEPDVHICLPPLIQLRAITDRFVKLAPEKGKIMLMGNMDGGFRMRVEADTVKVESEWSHLVNPILDHEMLAGENGTQLHPSQKREKDAWAAVRVEARDWARVVKVGALGKRVIACFCEDHALVLYVYLDAEEQNSAVLTYYISSHSA